MGYFPNGSSGMDYEEQWCSRCIHNENCAVWDAHFDRNYEECNNERSILHMLIPRSEGGLGNAQCLMFAPKRPRIVRKPKPQLLLILPEKPQ